MKKKGVALVEIVVSMLILAVAALAVAATVSMVNSRQMRSAGGSSLDLQALGYAKETLESLKNAVSTDTGGRGIDLVNPADVQNTLPAAFRNPPVNGTRSYTISAVAGTDLKQVTVVVTWDD